MSLLDFRKPKCVVLKSIVSWSGKYKLFYGHHYVQGHLCHDVGSINQQNGEIVTRHYCSYDLKLKQDNPAAKSEALDCYNEYEKALRRPPESEEYDDRVFKSPASN